MPLHKTAADVHAPATHPARVVLVGMMGSGKSSVGRALRERTGWPFVDNDRLVERATGLMARELLQDRGAEAMRRAESDALRAGVGIEPPVVVSAAAGTILDASNRALIVDAGLVVWLRAPAEALAARSVRAIHRPWLDDDPVRWLERTLAEREPLYASVADVEIDTTVVSAKEAAELIVDRLSPRD